MRSVVRLLIALVVVGILAIAGGWVWLGNAANTPVDPDGKSKPTEFLVQKGRAWSTLGPELEAAKLLKSAFVLKLYRRLHPLPDPKAGRHIVHPGMTIDELAAALADNPLPDDVPLTIIEGSRLMDTDAQLAGSKLIEPGEYLRAAHDIAKFKLKFPSSPGLKNFEGYLFPETYAVPVGKIDVYKLIQRQLDAFGDRFYVPNRGEIEASGRTLHQLVIVASMLEREEPDPPTRPKVAGVIYRRLDQNIPLGIDATSRYQLTDWNDRRTFLAALRDENEIYNTRLRAGLPHGPIGAASLPSLLAALRPEKSPYLYYLHDAQRRIHFARTAEEHEENRRKYNVY